MAPVAPVASASAAPPLRRDEPGRSAKDAFLNEIKKQKASFYNMVVAQAQKIEMSDDRIVFSFSAPQKFLHEQVLQSKGWLESLAEQSTGRRFTVASVHAADAPASSNGESSAKNDDRKTALRRKALADPGVQTMLEVFPADIRDVEEM